MDNSGQINRGNKWFEIRRVADLKGQTKVLNWMETQESIVNDIIAYELTLSPVEEPVEPVDYSSYTVDELKALIDEKGLDRTDITLKADLIKLLEDN